MAEKVVSIFEVADYERQVGRAAEVLRAGKMVILPTETVYGVAGSLRSAAARGALRAVRTGGAGVVGSGVGGAGGGGIGGVMAEAGARPRPLTVHVTGMEGPAGAMQFLGEVGELGRRLMRKLWPGPVGLVFTVSAERRREVAAAMGLPEAEIYDEAGAVTLRCADHLVAADVIEAVGSPVALTLAPTTTGGPALKASDVTAEVSAGVDLVLDAGPSRYTKPSTLLRVMEDRYEVIRAGVFDQRIIERMLTTTVLFVCSGNTCRSPMASAIARKIVAEKLGVGEEGIEDKGVSVGSAGTFAVAGARATPQAVEAVRGLGADLSRHRSRTLTVELVHQADVIYTMGRSHLAAVLAMVPAAREKAMLLDLDGDIEDPIGSDVTVYKSLAGHLEGLIRKRLDQAGIV